mgnify:CR=1 FL=1
MYRFRAIILNITRIRDNNTRIVMLTREYWKITWWWSKKNITGIDLWDVVEVLISRDENKNTIKNVDFVTSWWNKNWNYSQIFSFLKTLHIINQISIDNHECFQLFDDTYFLIRYGIKNVLNSDQYTIFQMRVLKSLWSMNPDILGNDPILQYIYKNITHSPLERVLSANIKNNHINIIEQANLNSLYTLKQ